MSQGSNLKEKINELIHKAAENQSFEIYESSIFLQGKNSRLVIKIDNGSIVSFEDCEKYSRELDSLLTLSDLLPNFALEVSSPGLKRELRNVKEYKRFLNSPIKVSYLSESITKVIKGLLKDVNEDSMNVESEGKSYNIDFTAIKKVNLDY